MALMTGEQYIESIKKIKMEIYMFGERYNNPTESPILRPSLNSVRMTYDLAQMPEYEDLMTVVSPYTGTRVNRFTHIHQSTEDLVKKVKMLRMISQKTGTCYQRCVGFDAMNATYSVTYEIDQAMGTNYHERFKKYLEYVQENDLMIAGAMTDVKGDRSLRPGQQKDPDLFVHVVEKRDDGIVIRGAKAHMTGMVNSHEMLIMPTMGMKEDEAEYAVCCAIPVDAEGVLHIFGRQTNDDRKAEGDLDHVADLHGVGGDVHLLAVDQDVAMQHQLTSLRTGSAQAAAGDNVIQTALHQNQQVIAGLAGSGSCLLIVSVELLFQNTVDELDLLLLSKLDAILALFSLHLAAGVAVRGLLRITHNGRRNA